MTHEERCAKMLEAIDKFAFEGEMIDYAPFGNGHINDTFVVNMKEGHRYILQRINHDIFKKPWEQMDNIENICAFLRKKIEAAGGDPDRETMNIVKAYDGKNYYQDSIGSYWSAYLFIEGASTYDLPETPEDFYQSGVGYGRFQKLLADYPAETLYETIAGFHDTPKRFERFKEVVALNPMGRAKEVQAEIDFVLAHEADCHVLHDLNKAGKLPLRVTHNDTKLNNIMLDNETRKALCVIDLGTVMPGFLVNDFGESIRFGAATSVEDEPDLSKMNFDIELFDIFAKGFLGECGDIMNECEFDMLPVGSKIMTFENGMRFLTDYLEGDVYYRIHYPEQNLNRCRTQFKLVRDMEENWDAMHKVISKYRK